MSRCHEHGEESGNGLEQKRSVFAVVGHEDVKAPDTLTVESVGTHVDGLLAHSRHGETHARDDHVNLL